MPRAKLPERPEGHCTCVTCHGDCWNPIPKKWMLCRPCVKGWHATSCPRFVQSEFPRLELGCRECGYELVEHAA